MIDFISVIQLFLSNIISLEVFLYFVMSLVVFGVILLVRKIVFA